MRWRYLAHSTSLRLSSVTWTEDRGPPFVERAGRHFHCYIDDGVPVLEYRFYMGTTTQPFQEHLHAKLTKVVSP